MREIVCPGWICRMPSKSGQVFFTFDDGPDMTSTMRLLDELSRLSIPATMFLTGLNCMKWPLLVEEIHSRGHNVGLHGHVHRRMNFASRGDLLRSLWLNEQAIRVRGVEPQRLYRPPHGAFNPWTSRILDQSGYRGVLWSTMASEWRKNSNATILKRLQDRVQAGEIFVFHDRSEFIDRVVYFLAPLYDEVMSRGLSFGQLGQVNMTASEAA